MALDIFRFITPTVAPDPNGAVHNAITSLSDLNHLRREDQRIKNQAEQFAQTEERLRSAQNWDQRKDIHAALEKYNGLLATNPEQAALFESQLRALGIEFHPAEQAQPPAAPEEPEAPSEPEAPTTTPNANVPAWLTKAVPQGDAAPTDDVAPPEEIQQALQKPMTPDEGRAVEGLGRMSPIFDPLPPVEQQTKPSAYRATWNGIDLGTFDPSKATEINKRQAEGVGAAFTEGTLEQYRPLIQSLMKNARTPEEAKQLMELFGTPEVLKLIGADAAREAAKGKSAKAISGEFDKGRKYVSELITAVPGFKTSQLATVSLPGAVRLLESDSPVQQQAGLRELAKAMNSGGVLTDRDADAPLQSLSLFARLKNEGSKLFFGHMSDDVRQELLAATKARLETAQAIVSDVRENVVSSVKDADIVSEQYQKGIRAEFRKVGLGDPNLLKFPGSAGKKRPAQAATPTGGDEPEPQHADADISDVLEDD